MATSGYMEDNSIPVTFRLPVEIIGQLDEMARRTFRKRSDLLRFAVDNILRDGVEVATTDAGKEVAE
jgi:predicted transcriptional regulator